MNRCGYCISLHFIHFSCALVSLVSVDADAVTAATCITLKNQKTNTKFAAKIRIENANMDMEMCNKHNGKRDEQ